MGRGKGLRREHSALDDCRAALAVLKAMGEWTGE
jgi:hypothetical protein